MDNQNAVPAPAAGAVNVSALESLLREKATDEEREAVLQEIGQLRGSFVWVNELRAALAKDDLVMRLAEYYNERLAVTHEEQREKLRLEIGKAARFVNTQYLFPDESELWIYHDGATEVEN